MTLLVSSCLLKKIEAEAVLLLVDKTPPPPVAPKIAVNRASILSIFESISVMPDKITLSNLQCLLDL